MSCLSYTTHLILLCVVLGFPLSDLPAQENVGIGTTSPDSTAILDISSNNKGVLIPRMSSPARQNIVSPAFGLMVFDSTANAFYYFNGNAWLTLLAGSVDHIEDADGDTKIQVEESPDENVVRFDVSGGEFARMDGRTLHLSTNGENVFVGQNAGSDPSFDPVVAKNNTFIGYNAGANTTQGDANTALGHNALFANQEGIDNTAIGVEALSANNGGAHNTAIGKDALKGNDEGMRNTGTGEGALEMNGAGNNNVALGYYAMRNKTAGNANIAIGMNALSNNITGNHNTAIGLNAGMQNNGSDNLFIGYNAGTNETGSNRLYISNSDVDSSEALVYGEFDNTMLRINGRLTPTAGITDIDGDTKIQVEESANENVVRFDVAGSEVFTITDTVSTFIGTGRGLIKIKTVNNAVETGLAFQNAGSSYTWSIYRSAANIPDLVFSGGNTANDVEDLTERLRITAQGNVGIGTDTASVKFQVGKSGDGTVARANAWNIFSDRRWKTDLAVITNAMEKIEAINGYYYKWRDRPDTTMQVGVIAQEIEAVLPEVVSTDAEGYKSVDYSKLTALLIQAMKEQQEHINQLDTWHAEIRAELNSIRSLSASTASMAASHNSF